MAGNIANAATRSIIDGSDFGDNVIASLPDTIAQTIMDVAGRAVTKATESHSSEIEVSANKGRTNDVLAPTEINDPALRVLVNDRSKYDLGKLDDAYGKADGKRSDDAKDVTAKKKTRDIARFKLAITTYLAASDPTFVLAPSHLRALQKDFNHAQSDLDKAEVKLAASTGKAKTASAALQPALQADRALADYFIGKTVTTLNGTPKRNSDGSIALDSNGQVVFTSAPATGSYIIKGPNFKYASADDAAFDAAALSRSVSASLGDTRERAVYIRVRPDGS